MTGYTPGTYHVLKVARTFIENEPEQFGIYAPRTVKGFFNGDLVALCPKEGDATLFAAAPDLLGALQSLTEWGRTHTSPLDPNSPHDLLIAAMEAISKATGETV